MKILKQLTTFCIILLLVACASTAPQQACKPAIEAKPACEPQQNGITNFTPKTADVHVYLAFAEQFSNGTLEYQKLAFANTQQLLVANPSDLLQRFKLAMIYSLPSSNLQDFAKAQNLLQAIIQETNLSNSQLAYAHLLFDYLIDMNKAEKNSRNDEKRMDTILQKNENLQNKLDLSQQKLTNTQQKLDAALQKIDELKNIEKSMGQRETPKK